MKLRFKHEANMTFAQELRLAAAEWQAVHEALHGPLDRQTAETVYEATEFLITVAQVIEGQGAELKENANVN